MYHLRRRIESWVTQDLTTKNVCMLDDDGLWSNRTVYIVDIDILVLLNTGEFLQSKSVEIWITVVLGVARHEISGCIV